MWSLVLSQKIDDVKAQAIQRALRLRVEKFTKDLFFEMEATARRCQEEVEKLKQTNATNDDIRKSIESKPPSKKIALHSRAHLFTRRANHSITNLRR